jgi:plastocyanin
MMSSSSRAGRAAILALAAAALLPAAAFGAFDGARASSGHTVVLKEIRFHPGNLTIHHGDSVTWQWRDGGVQHNVTFHSSHSRTMGHGSYTLHFTRKGTFNYHCTIHGGEGMVGKIVVR